MYRFLPMLLAPLVVSGCAGVECADMTGDWTLTVTDVTSSCGPEDDWTSSLAIEQADCESTRVSVAGIKGDASAVTGTLDGDGLTISGAFDEEGGVTELTLVLSQQSDTEFTGTESWEWFQSADDTDATCTGGTANVTLAIQ